MLASLQIGRALAAIAVAAFHLSIGMGKERYGGDAVFWDFTQRGNLGVDFFFVLSGFIILFAHQKDIDRPGQVAAYASRRIIRVYPIYLLYTVLYVGLVMAGFGAAAVMPESIEGWLTAFTLVYFGGGESPLPVAWTLIHEVAFYLVFAVLILNRKLGAAVLVAWVAIILVNYRHPDYDSRTWFDVYFGLYNLNFIIGMMAFGVFKYFSPRTQFACLLGGIVLLVIAWSGESGGWLSSESSLLCYAAGFGGVLAGVASLEKLKGGFPKNFLVSVGDASYSLYLLHLPIEGVLLKIGMKLSLDEILGRELLYVLVLVGTVIGSVVAYRCVEAPLISSLNRRARRAFERGLGSASAIPPILEIKPDTDSNAGVKRIP